MKKGVLVLAVLVLLLAAGYAGVQWYVDREAKKKVDQAIAQKAALGGATYKKVHVDLLDRALRVKEAEIFPSGGRAAVPIGEIVVHGYDLFGPQKTDRVHVELQRMHLDVEKNFNPAMGATLKELGYGTVDLDMVVNYASDEAAKVLDVREVSVDVDNMARLSLGARLEEWQSPQPGGDNPMAVLGTLMRVALASARLEIEDRALLAKLKDSAAKLQKNGQDSYAEARKEFQDKAGQSTDPKIAAMYKELALFLDDPKHLLITLAPQSPVSFYSLREVRDPEEIIRKLGLSVTR
jgi:hypothetical protein